MDKEQYDIMFRLEDHHWWYLGMREITSTLLSRNLNGTRSPRILDAGCGTGGMVQYLGKFGRVYGVDVAAEAMDGCRQRGLRTVSRGSIEAIPFADASFDVVVSFDVLYHQSVIDDVRALAEFNRVLKPGGLLLIRVPAYDWLRGVHDAAVHTRHRYSRTEMRAKLAATGFRPRKLSYVNSLLFPVAATVRLTEGTHKPLKSDLEMPSPATNWLLHSILRAEAALLRYFSFRWGLSVAAVAEKRSDLASRAPDRVRSSVGGEREAVGARR